MAGITSEDVLESFAHVVSHDLRAPLRGMSVHLRLLEKELEEAGLTVERIDIMQERLRQMDAMLTRLREFSRLQSLHGEPEPLVLAELVKECWQRIDRNGQKFHVQGDATWQAPPLLATLVIEEMLRGSNDESATVSVKIAPGEVVVADDKARSLQAERVGDPFEREAGAGWALARHIMARLGGELDVACGEEGTRASIRWAAGTGC